MAFASVTFKERKLRPSAVHDDFENPSLSTCCEHVELSWDRSSANNLDLLRFSDKLARRIFPLFFSFTIHIFALALFDDLAAS